MTQKKVQINITKMLVQLGVETFVSLIGIGATIANDIPEYMEYRKKFKGMSTQEKINQTYMILSKRIV